jgi:hypothetical protein
VMDKVALGQVFLRVLRFSPVNIIPPLRHIHLCIIWGMDKGHKGTSAAQFHRDIVSPHRNNYPRSKGPIFGFLVVLRPHYEVSIGLPYSSVYCDVNLQPENKAQKYRRAG